MSLMMVAVTMTMMVVQMIGVLDIEAARHHEDVAVRPHDVNIGAIEPGKDRRRHGLVDSAEYSLCAAQIQHAIQRTEQLIEFVRAEQDGDFAFAANSTHDVDCRFLPA